MTKNAILCLCRSTFEKHLLLCLLDVTILLNVSSFYAESTSLETDVNYAQISAERTGRLR